MQQEHGIYDSLIVPDNTTKIKISDPLLASWIKHGGPNDAGYPKLYLDNNPHQVRYQVKHADLQEVVELLRGSLLMDGWMSDCWEYDYQILGATPSQFRSTINKSIQYITDLMTAYGGYDTLFIRL